jgi:hypothetical protein
VTPGTNGPLRGVRVMEFALHETDGLIQPGIAPRLSAHELVPPPPGISPLPGAHTPNVLTELGIPDGDELIASGATLPYEKETS